jgi:quinol monooxygenase YgiN
MTTIEKRPLLTLINVFTVDPGQQNQLVALLTDATETTMKRLPGFISANIHRSLDGSRVVNYAQWENKAAFEAMRANPEAIPHMKAAAALAKFDPILCEVVEAIDRD